MPEPTDPDLFDAAGLVLEEHRLKSKPISQPKRPRKPKPPTPAEHAAVVRLEGARRSRSPESPAQRAPTPVAGSTAQVHAFPPYRNTRLVAALLERFQALLKQHEREKAKILFERTHLTPMRAQLIKLGLSPVMIENEVYALKAAVRDLGWRHYAERTGRIGA